MPRCGEILRLLHIPLLFNSSFYKSTLLFNTYLQTECVSPSQRKTPSRVPGQSRVLLAGSLGYLFVIPQHRSGTELHGEERVQEEGENRGQKHAKQKGSTREDASDLFHGFGTKSGEKPKTKALEEIHLGCLLLYRIRQPGVGASVGQKEHITFPKQIQLRVRSH